MPQPKLNKPVVLCLGDSNTNGFYAGAWVPSLAAAMPHLHFINTGVNGTQAVNVRAALPRHLATAARATGGPLVALTLLVGTNDCLLSLAQDANDRWGTLNYRLGNGYTGPANAASFKEQISGIIADLDKSLASPPLASPSPPAAPPLLMVLTLPPLGEDLGSRHNRRVDDFNAAIREAVREHQERERKERKQRGGAGGGGQGRMRVVLLDLNTLCVDAIRRATAQAGSGPSGGAGATAEPADATSGNVGANSSASSTNNSANSTRPLNRPAPPCRRPPRCFPASFLTVGLGVVACAFRRHVLGVPLDRQVAGGGAAWGPWGPWTAQGAAQSASPSPSPLAPDCIHLSEAGAGLVGGLVERELRSLEVLPQTAEEADGEKKNEEEEAVQAE